MNDNISVADSPIDIRKEVIMDAIRGIVAGEVVSIWDSEILREVSRRLPTVKLDVKRTVLGYNVQSLGEIDLDLSDEDLDQLPIGSIVEMGCRGCEGGEEHEKTEEGFKCLNCGHMD